MTTQKRQRSNANYKKKNCKLYSR